MIVLKITNSSEFLASKIGKFLESLTPDSFDDTTVEEILLRKLIENLEAGGLRGEVAAVKGLDLATNSDGTELVLHEKMRIRHHESF